MEVLELTHRVKVAKHLKKCATSLTTLFVSTYLGKSAFSTLKIIKSKYHSTISDNHLETFLIDLVWFYGISTIVVYLMPNPFLYI